MWIGAHERPPEQEPGAEVERMLQSVDGRVVECRVEERAEVAGPDDDREDDPAHRRVADDPYGARVNDGQDAALARLGRADPEQQRDRRPK